MYLKISTKQDIDIGEERWSGSPFVVFKKNNQKKTIFGEADVYKSNGIDCLIEENFDIDGRFVCVKLTSEYIRVYSDKNGFVKPYIHLEENSVQITTDASDVYKLGNSFTSTGVACFMELGYVPAPYSLYDAWKVIPPGYYAEISVKNSSVTFKRWWSLTLLDDRFDQNNFWDAFCSEISSLEDYNSVDPTILLSGGIDSRLISRAVDREKNSLFVRMSGFLPDEKDALIISRYSEKIKGRHREKTITLSDAEIEKAFIESSFSAIDHAHMGRWKFHLLLSQGNDTGDDGLFLNGQTADTLLMKNIPGDNLVSRLTRALYSNHAKLLNFPGLLPVLLILAKFLPENKSQKLNRILCSWNSVSYYSGYLLNPGFLPGKRSRCNVVDEILDEMIGELSHTYGTNVDLIMTDLLLRTFIWGTDMRGIEDASKVFGLKMRFVFMQKKVMEMIVSLPFYSNPQFGAYKKFFRKIDRYLLSTENICTVDLINNKKYFSNLEQELSQTTLGLLFQKIKNQSDFFIFQNVLRDLNMEILKFPQDDDKSNKFIRLQRLCTLYLFWKFMNGEKADIQLS